jgi:hypothetical protein
LAAMHQSSSPWTPRALHAPSTLPRACAYLSRCGEAERSTVAPPSPRAHHRSQLPPPTLACHLGRVRHGCHHGAPTSLASGVPLPKLAATLPSPHRALSQAHAHPSRKPRETCLRRRRSRPLRLQAAGARGRVAMAYLQPRQYVLRLRHLTRKLLHTFPGRPATGAPPPPALPPRSRPRTWSSGHGPPLPTPQARVDAPRSREADRPSHRRRPPC